jgi:hypothetical protein
MTLQPHRSSSAFGRKPPAVDAVEDDVELAAADGGDVEIAQDAGDYGDRSWKGRG